MSKGKSTTKQSTNQTLDPYSRNQYEAQLGRTQGMLDGGYQGSWGATQLSDSEQQAGGLINQYVGSYSDGLGQARDQISGAQVNFGEAEDMVRGAQFQPGTLTPKSFADFNADTYVNPYADDIIQQTTGDLSEARDRAQNQIGADTLSSGAFGGSRHGVREGLLNESYLDSVADMSANTRYNVWNQGADRFYQDVGNDMSAQMYNADQVNQGAQFDLQRSGMLADYNQRGAEFDLNQGAMLADLVGQERAYQDQDIGRLMNYGASERAVADTQGAREYDDYWRRIQAEMGLLSSVPMLVDSTGQSTQTTNPGLLGTVGTLANGAGAIFGTGGLWPMGGRDATGT